MDSQPTWDWSSIRDSFNAATSTGAEPETSERRRPAESASEPQPTRNDRRYGPRTCRICLDTEDPKYPTNASTVFGVASNSSRPTYISDDPELGRLLSPCKCKGSQKYVHEGCLKAWRLSNPTAERNYWQCPTCKFTYRMDRLHWAAILSSKVAQVVLTVVVLIIGIFILGFIADPLFDLWYDPFGVITDTVSSVVNDIEAMEQPAWNPPSTWAEHFTKGFFSLGLVGFFKTVLATAPWHLINLRSSGYFGGARRGGTGRARVENMSMILVFIGALTFLMAVWRFVKMLSARVLRKFSDRVLDINGDDGDDDDGGGVDNGTRKDQ